MVRVRRRAIGADRCARGIVRVVEPVVAVGTQAAERAKPGRGEVASVRLNVVGSGRWRDAAGFQVKPTKL
jgi:hypothetical protein